MRRLALSSSLSLSLVLCFGATSVRAQDPAAASADKGVVAVEKAYAAQQAAVAEMQKQMAPLREKMADKNLSKEERAAVMKRERELRESLAGPSEAFNKLFAESDWSKFDPKHHADILKSGLMACTRSDSAEVAVRACKMFVERFPDERAAEGIRTNTLPGALLLHGDVDEARQLLTAAAESKGAGKTRALLTLGDLAAALGDSAAANKHYAAADEAADKATAAYVTLRKELYGKPAPEVDSKTWIGGDATPLSAIKAKAIVVDFWATWCGPCRMVMPKLSELYTAHKDHGLQVLGLTHFYKNGYMPRTKAETQSGGENVNGMDEATFKGHVEQFRKVTEMSYPFVIGTDEDFKKYKVQGIPTLVVLDGDHKVVYVSVGAGPTNEALLKIAVERLVAGK